MKADQISILSDEKSADLSERNIQEEEGNELDNFEKKVTNYSKVEDITAGRKMNTSRVI